MARRGEEITTFRTQSRLVVVDVVVKQKNGFVKGLTAQDFQLFEDGKPQRIVSVTEGAQPMGVPPPPANYGKGVYSNAAADQADSPASIILYDLLNTEPIDREIAKQKLLQFIKTAPEGHRIAILTLTTELRVLTTFTTDKKLLQQAAERQNRNVKDPLIREKDTAELQNMATLWTDAAGGAFTGLIEGMQRAEANFAEQKMLDRVRTTTLALKGIARFADRFSGRKALVWLSAGFPLQIDTIMGKTDFSEPLRETGRALNAAQVAVYPVDVRGMGQGSVLSSSDPSRQGAVGSMSMGGGIANAANASSSTFRSPQETMREVADLTGGQAYYNRNDIDVAIKNALNDNAASYTLAYYPTNKNYDGSYRKLKVTLNRSDVQLRHRPGYYADDFRQRRTALVNKRAIKNVNSLGTDTPEYDLLLALEGDPTVSSQIEVLAHLDPEEPESGKPFKIEMFVGGRSLQFVNNEKGQYLADTTFGFTVMPEQETGKVLSRQIETRYSGFSQQQYHRLLGSAGILYNFTVPGLKKGNHRLRIGVRDNYTRRIGTVEIPLEVK